MKTSHAARDAWLRLCVALTVFGLMVWIVSLPPTHRLDEASTRWLQRAAPLPDLPAAVFVRLGNAELLIPAVAVLAAGLALVHRPSGIAGVRLVAGLVAASLLAVTLKHIIVHPGPPEYLVRSVLPGGLYIETPYSFPSGHTLRVTLLAGTALRRSRAAGLLVLGMMLALVYLGNHWLSDVLGGLCLGWVLMEAGKVIRIARSRNYRQG